MNAILITGSSSGFGLETARYFLDRDWTVIATMRTPRKDVLPASERLRVVELDVADATSIARAVEEAGPIDALVNNAGAGLMGALEGVSIDATRQLFELNTFGTMAMTQAVLPGFRRQASGVIVNVSSAVTLKPLPMLSAYTASKAAMEAFSEDLALEVASFGVRVRLVIPGRAPETSFSAAARSLCRLGQAGVLRSTAAKGRSHDSKRRGESRLARSDRSGFSPSHPGRCGRHQAGCQGRVTAPLSVWAVLPTRAR